MKKKAYFTVILFLIMTVSAQATLIIDQNQPEVYYPNYVTGSFFSESYLIQSFQQSNNNIAGAGISLTSNLSNSGYITIELWDALPYVSGANMLTSGGATGTAGTWVDVFWTPFAVTPDVTLFLQFSSSNTNMGIDDAINNPYPFGQVYANQLSFPNFDYTFRTYAEVSVPEPATLLLLGLGLIGLAGVRRKFKN